MIFWDDKVHLDFAEEKNHSQRSTIRPEIITRTLFILLNYLIAKWRNVTENCTFHSTPITRQIASRI